MNLLSREYRPQKRGIDQHCLALSVLSLQPWVPPTVFFHGEPEVVSFLISIHTTFLDGAADFSLLSPSGQRLKFQMLSINSEPGVILATPAWCPPSSAERWGPVASAYLPAQAVDNYLTGDFFGSSEVVLDSQGLALSPEKDSKTDC